MVHGSDREGVLAAIEELGDCLAARDLAGTLALLADDPDVTVIPSEGVEAHRGRAARVVLWPYLCRTEAV
jgi:hypothetical protein